MTKQQSSAPHPAQEYNRVRRIIMSKAYDDVTVARQWLSETYRKSLGSAGFAGMMAELEFFSKYRKDFKLFPGLDVGDATDFGGEIEGRLFRIDVTTNLAYKSLETYEPFQVNGDLYKIALYSEGKFEIIDINFPFCTLCSTGRIFNVGLLHGPNHKDGDFTFDNDQSLVRVCGSCGEYSIDQRITSANFPDFDEMSQSIQYDLYMAHEDDFTAEEEAAVGDEFEKRMRTYATESMRYLKKEFGETLMAIGSPGYKVTGRRGEGHYAVDPTFVDQFVSSRFLDRFDFDFYDLPDRNKNM